MAIAPFSVKQVNDYIARLFKSDYLLRPVVVKGEISSIGEDRKGNIYISLSEDRSKLDLVIFSNMKNDVVSKLQIGDEVIAAGNIEAYAAQSKYSLWVRDIEIAGAGDAAAKFEELKQKLLKEGLFDKDHKLPIPEFPKHIGIVTSATGAAVEDIIKILTSRTNITDITVFPVLVQGPDAAEDMIKMIGVIEREYKGDVDLIIIGRGGGSAEDLAAFNDEGLARAIYNCTIPIISAVGHEVDISISDFVADMRAETPTAAAQMAVHSISELNDILKNSLENLNFNLSNRVLQEDFTIVDLRNSLDYSLKDLVNKYEKEIDNSLLILKENNPLMVLNKGYSLVTDLKGKPISDIDHIKKDEEYNIVFKSGEAKVKAIDKRKKVRK